MILVVSNPVDVLTYLATTQMGLPPPAGHRPGDDARLVAVSQA